MKRFCSCYWGLMGLLIQIGDKNKSDLWRDVIYWFKTIANHSSFFWCWSWSWTSSVTGKPMGAVSILMCRNLSLPTSFGPLGLAGGGSHCVAVLVVSSSWMSLSENLCWFWYLLSDVRLESDVNWGLRQDLKSKQTFSASFEADLFRYIDVT